MSDITHLNNVRATQENDNSLESPAELLRRLADEIERGERKIDKMMVLSLEHSEGAYLSSWCASNIRSSEMISLLEVSKVGVFRSMGLTD